MERPAIRSRDAPWDAALGRFGSLDDIHGRRLPRYSLRGDWRRGDATSMHAAALYGTLLRPRSLLELHLLPRRPGARRSVRAKGSARPRGGSSSTDVERRAASALNLARQRSGSNCATTTSATAFSKRSARTGIETTRHDHAIETSAGALRRDKTQWTELVSHRGRRARRISSPSMWITTSARTPAMRRRDRQPEAEPHFRPVGEDGALSQRRLRLHSNDARGVIRRRSQQRRAAPADPLVRTNGAEIGIRTTIVPGLQSSLTAWFSTSIASCFSSAMRAPPRRRVRAGAIGIEWANLLRADEWLTLDADFALSHARFRDDAPEGQRIPGSVETVISAGVSVHDLGGFYWRRAPALLRTARFDRRRQRALRRLAARLPAGRVQIQRDLERAGRCLQPLRRRRSATSTTSTPRASAANRRKASTTSILTPPNRAACASR